MDYKQLMEITQGKNFPCVGENDEKERVVIEKIDSNERNYFKVSAFQSNGWTRTNIYYEDGSCDETYEKFDTPSHSTKGSIKDGNMVDKTTSCESGNSKVLTVRELANHYATLIGSQKEMNFKIPACDFAIAEIPEPESDIETIKLSSSGWYGIKAVDLGFDSEDLCFAADYYGGGCLETTQVYCGELDETTEKDLLNLLLKTMSYQETVDENTLLIVEFEVEKGDDKNA